MKVGLRAVSLAVLTLTLTGPAAPAIVAGRVVPQQHTEPPQQEQESVRQQRAELSGGSCVACHEGLPDERISAPVERYRDDVHAAQGFDCVACHGGDASEMSLDAMDPETGYVGVPEPQEIAEVCGRCHSNAAFMRRYDPSLRVDQVAEYRTSVHGQRLYDLEDAKVATCASCHPAHSVKPPSDPSSSVHPLNVAETCGACHADSVYMAEYSIPTDQRARYHESVHWRKLSDEGDLSAPTCNDCHGNHGAAPPGVEWVGNVCGQCHSVMGRLFNASFHSEIFTLLGSPGCATCHGNHAITQPGDTLLGVTDGAVCGRCHTTDSRGGAVATTMRSLIDSLEARVDSAHAILGEAENAGMEVSQAQFSLSDAESRLIKARTAIHAFNVDSVEAEVGPGLEVASAAYGAGREALDELQFRRTGLAVSVTIILVLIIGLVLKIREVESGSELDSGSASGG